MAFVGEPSLPDVVKTATPSAKICRKGGARRACDSSGKLSAEIKSSSRGNKASLKKFEGFSNDHN